MERTESAGLKPAANYLHRNVWLACCLILTIFINFPISSFAETSALSGLGEPAAPASLASPARTTTPSVAEQSNLQAPSQANTAPISLPPQDALAPVIGPALRGLTHPGSESNSPLVLHQAIEKSNIDGHGMTLKEAVDYAEQNYPNILKSRAQVDAAQQGVHLQKLNEYLPDALFQFQEIMASHNKLDEVFFGSPVFAGITGPAFPNVNFQPMFSSGAGASIDWAPIDFGLHRARIDMSKAQYKQSQMQYGSTQLDVGLSTAGAFLDTVVAYEQVKAAQQNMLSFKQFSDVVHAQVGADLKPGADASLADAQYANARNDLIRANLAKDIAVANLANTLGIGGQPVLINEAGIVDVGEPAQIQQAQPIFDNVPILKAAGAALQVQIAQKKILDKEYFPVFHFMGGFNVRGAGLSNIDGRPTGAQGHGTLPAVPNYTAAVIINWNFLDIYRIRAQKKVQIQRISEQQQEYSLILQSLRTQDVQSRARVKAALALAENMPIQTEAARVAVNQSEARYKTGLGSIAQVAEANQTLANSRVQEAMAKVGVWRALLAVASVHGDLKPFLAEIDRVQRGM